jgi:hypothetical protein
MHHIWWKSLMLCIIPYVLFIGLLSGRIINTRKYATVSLPDSPNPFSVFFYTKSILPFLYNQDLYSHTTFLDVFLH